MAATPVVLLHGIRVSGAMWRPQIRRLEADRPVVAVDLPGHGVRAGQPFTMATAVEVVAKAIDAVGGRALLAGISMGGYVGIAAASKLGESVAGLLSIGCTAVPSPRYALPYRVMAKLGGRSGHAVQRGLFRVMLGKQAGRTLASGGLYTQVVPEVAAAVLDFDPLAALASYAGPVWFVNGERDHFRIDEERFLAACETGRLQLVPGAGHLVSLSHPDEISAAIESAAACLDDCRENR